MRTTVELVTPDIAKKWLEKNVNNRPLRTSTVTRYAAMMSKGQWKLTHEAIAFDTNGDLKNGQHRLAAVVMSGASVQFQVTRGVDPSTFEVIDSGLKRSLSDRLQQVNVPYYTTAASALRYLLLYERARDIRWLGTTPSSMVSDQDVMRLAEHIGQDLLLEAGTHAHRAAARDVAVTITSGMAGYLLFKDADPEDRCLTAFWDGLVSGVELKRNDPRLAMRRWAINTGGINGKGQRMLVSLIKAWNSYVKGVPLGTIKWLPTEPMPDVLEAATGKPAPRNASRAAN